MSCPTAPFPGLVKGSSGHMFALSQVILFPIFIFAGVIAFYSQRKDSLYLRKRSFSLLLLAASCSFVPYLCFGVYDYIGSENFPCALYIFFVYSSNAFVSYPLLLKVAQYMNRVALLRLQTKIELERRQSLANEDAIVGQNPLNGEMSFTTFAGHIRKVFCFSRSERDRILHAKFARTAGFRILWFSIICAPCLIAFLVRLGANPQWTRCTGCEIETVDAAILLGISYFALVASVLANPTILFRVSKRDPLRIVNESMLGWHVGGFLYNLGFILFLVDPFDGYKNGQFDPKWIILLATASLIYVQTFHQIIKSKRLQKELLLSTTLNQDERLEEVLASKKLRAELETYLHSELSPEILKFVTAVQLYKRKHADGNTANTKRLVENMYDEFIKLGAPLEINIGSSLKSTLAARIHQEDFSLDLFDASYAEVKRTLLLDGFARFLVRIKKEEESSKDGQVTIFAKSSRVTGVA